MKELFLLFSLIFLRCSGLTVDSIVAVDVFGDEEYSTVYICKLKQRRTVSLRECNAGHRGLKILTVARYEAGKKTVRWSIRRGGEELHRTLPISSSSETLSPPEDAKFSFRLVTWEGGVDGFCQDVRARSRGFELMGGVLLGAGDTVFPHVCVKDLVANLAPNDCKWKGLRISLLFGEWSFEEARGLLDDEERCLGEHGAGWEGARAILDSLLTAGETMRGERGGSFEDGELFLLKVKTTKSVASQKQLKVLLEIVAHQHAGSDVQMALAQELALAGHTDLAERHTMGLLGVGEGDFGEFCQTSPFETSVRGRERETFFVLRQCLQHYVPPTLTNEGEAAEMREGLLELLRAWNVRLEGTGDGGGVGGELNCLEPHFDVGIRHVFLVVYQGLARDSEVYKEMTKLHRNLCPEVLNWVDVREGEGEVTEGREKRVRVGLISNNLRFHSVGRLLRGVFGRLSRKQFELVILVDERKAGGNGNDRIFREISNRADRVVYLKEKFRDCQELLSGLELDVLVFGDIGMDAKTSLLAYGRYSPVQVAFWGHPVTTELESIDYFVGSENFGEFAESFGEQLVALEGSGVYWVDESDVGWDEGRENALLEIVGKGRMNDSTRLYVCPQSIMKLHPKFDRVIREIVQGDEDAVVVLLADTRKVLWGERVVERLRDLEDDGKVVFVEQMEYDDYVRLVCAADVSLDPFPFGGGVTMLESLGCGVPIVTDTDELKVFHLGSAWLELSGLEHLKNGEGSYAQRAVALAKSTTNLMREAIRSAARENLFEDRRSVKEWESFLNRAAKSAA